MDKLRFLTVCCFSPGELRPLTVLSCTNFGSRALFRDVDVKQTAKKVARASVCDVWQGADRRRSNLLPTALKVLHHKIPHNAFTFSPVLSQKREIFELQNCLQRYLDNCQLAANSWQLSRYRWDKRRFIWHAQLDFTWEGFSVESQ